MSEAQAKLKFEVCPDDVKAEESGDTVQCRTALSTPLLYCILWQVFYNTIIGLEGDSEETLTCLASWQSDLDSKETFMLGTLDYRYKESDQQLSEN